MGDNRLRTKAFKSDRRPQRLRLDARGLVTAFKAIPVNVAAVPSSRSPSCFSISPLIYIWTPARSDRRDASQRRVDRLAGAMPIEGIQASWLRSLAPDTHEVTSRVKQTLGGPQRVRRFGKVWFMPTRLVVPFSLDNNPYSKRWT